MTFSILARDATGAIGMAVTSSSPAVAARCIHLRAHTGGVASQNITDPRFGPILLDSLEQGADAETALSKLVAADATMEYRQVAVVDRRGNTAAHSGAHTLGRHRVVTGDGVVAAGNLLQDHGVPQAMLDAFTASDGELENRLLAALAAGDEAGGEEGPVRSCGVSVIRDTDWRETDLRVDWHEAPIAELGRLLEVWLPQRDDYVTRGLAPQTAPSYGVPGDE